MFGVWFIESKTSENKNIIKIITKNQRITRHFATGRALPLEEGSLRSRSNVLVG